MRAELQPAPLPVRPPQARSSGSGLEAPPIVLFCGSCPLLAVFPASRGLPEVDARCAQHAFAHPDAVPAERAQWGMVVLGGLMRALDGLSQLAATAVAAGADPSAELGQAFLAFAAARHALEERQHRLTPLDLLDAIQRSSLAPARRLAAALWAWHQQPEQQAEHRLALARAAAGRACAYLRCANLAGEGGPAAGQGAGSSKCSACRMTWRACQASVEAASHPGAGLRRSLLSDPSNNLPDLMLTS